MNLYLNFQNPRINKKYLKVYAAKNEVQTRFTNCIAADFFINSCCIVTFSKLKNSFPNKNDNFRKKIKTLKNLYLNFKNLKINKST